LGTTLQYEIVITNLTAATITGATVQDLLPPELVNASWSCAPSPGSTCAPGSHTGDILDSVTVEAGDSLVYTLTATVAGGVGATISNTASVQAPGGAPISSTDHTLVDDSTIFSDGFEDGLANWYVSP
jgi:uncharacterized repeat protein (TIGR01451 family)